MLNVLQVIKSRLPVVLAGDDHHTEQLLTTEIDIEEMMAIAAKSISPMKEPHHRSDTRSVEDTPFDF